MADIARIEERLDRVAAGAIEISDTVGGLAFANMTELMEFAKLVSISGAAVPSHLRGNPGACLAVCIQALEWHMSPFAVANKSYLVNNKGEERIAYESQLIHAVIEARAPITGRLRYEILGEGDERRCKVWATFKGDTEPHIYISEPLAKLRDARGRNDYGKLKGSPLWDAQPEVQLFYSASRQWCRIYAPDTLLGIYTREELDETGPDHARDVTPAKPNIAARLSRPKGPQRGFSEAHVERETSAKAPEPAAETASTDDPAAHEAASGDAAGPAPAAPQSGQAQSDAAPAEPPSPLSVGEDVADADADKPSASASTTDDLLRRFSEVLFEVTTGGPRALMTRRKKFGEENPVTADRDKVEQIYKVHSQRLAYGKMPDDECRQRVAEIIGGAE